MLKILKMLKIPFKDERGMGTVEIVIIMAVLVGIALIFRHYIFGFVQEILDNIFGNEVNAFQNSPITPPSP